MAKSKFKKKIEESIAMIINKFIGNGLAQEEFTADGERYITPGMPEKVCELAEEGIVLLKNDNTLPISSEQKVSVFGRVQHDWFYVGYGSGGDVHPPYEVGLFEGLRNSGITYNETLKNIYDNWCEMEENKADHGYWGHWPYSYEEMPLDDSTVENARADSDLAIVIIGRAAGEDRENKLEEGSFYLTTLERDMLQKITAVFEKTVLIMNSGNIIDMSFTEEYRFSAILYAWQLGQENGNALGNILSGKCTPSGKLSDTIAKRYEDYPSSSNFGGEDFNNYEEGIFVGYRHFVTRAKDNILYPFGYGLSYTSFSIESEVNQDYTVTSTVTNTGEYPGKEVVQVYIEAPEGKLQKSKRVLVGYAKTRLLLPGESTKVTVSFDEYDFASFDEEGLAGYARAHVLESGVYRIYA